VALPLENVKQCFSRKIAEFIAILIACRLHHAEALLGWRERLNVLQANNVTE